MTSQIYILLLTLKALRTKPLLLIRNYDSCNKDEADSVEKARRQFGKKIIEYERADAV